MAKADFKSVDEYLATLPKGTQTTLQRVRAVIRKAIPRAEEVISYQIPALKLDGRAVIYFAAWKEHYSLYPATEKVVTAFARELSPFELRKGTIRFPLTEPVPTKLIAAIAKLRAQETVERWAERAAKRGKVSTRAAAKSKAPKPRATKKTRPRGKVKTSRPLKQGRKRVTE